MYGEAENDNLGPLPPLMAGEYVLWRGKPKRSAFIGDKALTMLPIAVIWLLFDSQFLLGGWAQMNIALIGFFALHLLPVWLWLGNTVTAAIQWRKAQYILTNQRLILKKGIFSVTTEMVLLKDVFSCDVHRGLLDGIFHSGDIWINRQVSYRHSGSNRRRSVSGYVLMDLDDAEAVQTRILNAVMHAGGNSQEQYR